MLRPEISPFHKEQEKPHVSSDHFHVLWEMPLHFLQIEQC